MLNKLQAVMSYSATGHESNVNESTICIKGVFKQKHIKQGYILTDWQTCDRRLTGTKPRTSATNNGSSVPLIQCSVTYRT